MIGIVNKQLTLSIIIPAYNEQHYIKSCLDSIGCQTQIPDEVIVVDNNSTDDTVAIAASYPFVRVVRQRKQGRGHARTKGFDAATSDIIGRIDADSVLEPDWCERVRSQFANRDVAGVTGLAVTDVLPRVHWPKSVVWTVLYHLWTIVINGYSTMWGANMAIRASAWHAVRDMVCDDDRQVHEDQDLSLCMLSQGLPVVVDWRMRIAADAQTFSYFPKLVYYTGLRHRTIRRHQQMGAYQQIRRPHALWWRLPLIAVSPLFFVPSFLTSFVFWPIDTLIIRVDKRFFRHTTR
jgi:glycosyltransferase involved in cell wall biosynthesis